MDCCEYIVLTIRRRILSHEKMQESWCAALNLLYKNQSTSVVCMCEVILDFLFALNHWFEGLLVHNITSSIYKDVSIIRLSLQYFVHIFSAYLHFDD